MNNVILNEYRLFDTKYRNTSYQENGRRNLASVCKYFHEI